MSETVLGYLLAISALLLFTTAILSTKLASRRIELGLGFLIATATNVLFSAFALAVQMALRERGVTWNWSAFWLFALAGGFSTYLGRWFFYESVVRFGAAKASVFQISSPLFTALMAWILLGEGLKPLGVLGMLMTIGGLVLVSYKPGIFWRKPAHVSAAGARDPPVVTVMPSLHQRLMQSFLLLGLGSSLAYAVGNILRGSAVRLWNEPVLGALAGAICGLTLHLAFSSGKRGMLANLHSVSRSGAWLYALVGVSTISAQMCMIASMRFIPLSVATLVTLCTPLLIFPINHWLFSNEDEVTAFTLVGGALTLLGIAIIVLR